MPIEGVSGAGGTPTFHKIEESDVKAILVNLINWMIAYFQKSASSEGASTKEGRIQEVQKQLENGQISIEQAAITIMMIIQDEAKKQEIHLPTLSGKDPNLNATKVLAQAEGLALVSHVWSLDESVMDAVNLSWSIDDRAITPDQAKERLNGILAQINDGLPPSQRDNY